VPVLGFDVYLTGFDVQSVDMRDVLEGRLPRTADAGSDPGNAISPQGPSSQDINFPGSAGPCAVVYPPNIDLVQPGVVAHLRAALTGRFSPLLDGCCGRDLGDNRARGYLTIDTVTQCLLAVPGDPGYFSGLADGRNILFGDYFYVTRSRRPAAVGEPMVHVVSHIDPAHPEVQPGQYTFYARFAAVSGQDRRQPLATNFAARYGPLGSGKAAQDTLLVVWRDPKVAQQPFPCGSLPSWFPLGQEKIIAFDEQEQAVVLSGTPFPAATQAVRVGVDGLAVPADAGWLYLNLNTTVTGVNVPVEDPGAAQAWVVVSQDPAGRLSRSYRAVPLDSATTANHVDPIEP
jgi:hypothetical protein